MLDQTLSFIAPHYCSGCGIVGELLCDNCKYDIVSEPFSACAACGKCLAKTNGICHQCRVPYQRAWCVADRHDQLQRLIDSYKFKNVRAAHRPLARLLHEYLPELPPNTVIVPVPTVSSHIRQRGYDHMLLIARRLGKLRKLPVDTSLRRITDTKQRDAGARQRTAQAKAAFSCRKPLNETEVYLLIDDVITTGSTVKYASKKLLSAGAPIVWVASISRQTLD